MAKRTQKNTNILKTLLVIFSTILIILIITICSLVGEWRGMIIGIDSVLHTENKTICSWLVEQNKNIAFSQGGRITLDTDGQCVVSSSRYQRMECFWGNVTTTVSSDNRTWPMRFHDISNNIAVYPLMGCIIK